jgi:oxygen-dependent protoporphyrinogen oxidase
MVTRWRHAFPQYRVGHLLRVAGIEAAVNRLPAVAIAGAPYRGVGIPACIASGREAARDVRRSLDTAPHVAS